jgi:hypothetical protein
LVGCGRVVRFFFCGALGTDKSHIGLKGFIK